MPRYSKSDVAESKARLLKLCTPGTVVYTTLRHVSRSGMLREISLHVVKGGEPVSISWDVARVLGLPLNGGSTFWAVRVTGCGMDMGFHVVNALSYALHGYKSKGADALAAEGRPFQPRRGHYRAGYSLTHRWI